jgi:hypothetical protein
MRKKTSQEIHAAPEVEERAGRQRETMYQFLKYWQN